MNYQAERISRIQSSPSMAVSQAAKEMVRQGINVVDLSLGEPDFNTPENIINAAVDGMRQGMTRYTASAGIPELKAAIIAKLARDNKLEYTAEEITVGNGAKQLIFNALMGTLEADDEVVLLAPYFVSYPDLVKLHGGTPRIVRCYAENNFRPTREDLAAAINEKTRWIILNTPSNPSGAVLSKEDLQMIGEVVRPFERLLVMSDEIYEKIVFEGTDFVSFGEACPALRDRTLIINGVSKSYAMTGWRIGYAAGPAGLIQVMNKLQSQSTTSACSISQIASVEAIDGHQLFVESSRLEYQKRRDLMLDGLRDIPQLKAFSPEGAFYLFAECQALLNKSTPDGSRLTNDADVANYFLKEAHVACVPGAAYGLEPFVRFSFATSEEQISLALKQLSAAINKLR
ncbi:pyridoxal phosphate-dependent aminotransferase [Klebsiella quasipneumoniae]|uniref:pyridoxal phosphate-dependent aminotransferase n=1 Tax=Klebsiella quasipneumoniae TaxID=1463165 RepID=UPI003DA06C0F